MRKIMLLAVLLPVAGCVTQSGIVPIGPDTYQVSSREMADILGMGYLKANAIKTASQYCVSQRKGFQVTKMNESSLPGYFWESPKLELQFICLKEDSPELTRPQKKDSAIVKSPAR